jgi:hypothetical protein
MWSEAWRGVLGGPSGGPGGGGSPAHDIRSRVALSGSAVSGDPSPQRLRGQPAAWPGPQAISATPASRQPAFHLLFFWSYRARRDRSSAIEIDRCRRRGREEIDRLKNIPPRHAAAERAFWRATTVLAQGTAAAEEAAQRQEAAGILETSARAIQLLSSGDRRIGNHYPIKRHAPRRRRVPGPGLGFCDPRPIV